MWQPNMNSEAVKRCMDIPNLPMSNQVARPIPPQRPLQPKPPYAYDGHNASKPARPFSGVYNFFTLLVGYYFVTFTLVLYTERIHFYFI